MTEIEQLTRLIALYSLLLDDGDYESWAGLFTHDGALIVGGRHFHGDELVALVTSVAPARPGRHFVGPPVIDILDATTAHAWTEMVTLATSEDGATSTGGFCRYHDVFTRTGDGWRFARRYLQLPGRPLEEGAPPVPRA